METSLPTPDRGERAIRTAYYGRRVRRDVIDTALLYIFFTTLGLERLRSTPPDVIAVGFLDSKLRHAFLHTASSRRRRERSHGIRHTLWLPPLEGSPVPWSTTYCGHILVCITLEFLGSNNLWPLRVWHRALRRLIGQLHYILFPKQIQGARHHPCLHTTYVAAQCCSGLLYFASHPHWERNRLAWEVTPARELRGWRGGATKTDRRFAVTAGVQRVRQAVLGEGLLTADADQAKQGNVYLYTGPGMEYAGFARDEREKKELLGFVWRAMEHNVLCARARREGAGKTRYVKGRRVAPGAISFNLARRAQEKCAELYELLTIRGLDPLDNEKKRRGQKGRGPNRERCRQRPPPWIRAARRRVAVKADLRRRDRDAETSSTTSGASEKSRGILDCYEGVKWMTERIRNWIHGRKTENTLPEWQHNPWGATLRYESTLL